MAIPKNGETMTKNSPVTIKRADGTVEIQPAYDLVQLRAVHNHPTMTDRQKAVLLSTCPTCAARPGRECRNVKNRRTFHPARLAAWKASKR